MLENLPSLLRWIVVLQLNLNGIGAAMVIVTGKIMPPSEIHIPDITPYFHSTHPLRPTATVEMSCP